MGPEKKTWSLFLICFHHLEYEQKETNGLFDDVKVHGLADETTRSFTVRSRRGFLLSILLGMTSRSSMNV